MSADHHWGYKPDGIAVERGDLLRWKANPCRAYSITSIGFDGIQVDYWSGQDKFPFHLLATTAEYSKDGGKTWFACNKLQTPSELDVQSEVQTKVCADAVFYAKPEKTPVLWVVLLSWPFCFLFSVIFVVVTVLLAIPGYLLSLLEPRFRKVMQ